MKRKFALVAMLFATGCAVAPPVHHTLVDYQLPGYDHQKYLRDNAECNQIAAQRGSDAASGAVGGLVAGALLGAIVGNAYGDTGHGAAYGAALGTAGGGLQGAASDASAHDRIVRDCMTGRGFRVLD